MNIMAGYRPSYTIEEEKQMINYIVKHNEFGWLKGDRLWKQMANSDGFERTWQSLKQHFRKKLINKLHYPELEIDQETQKKIYLWYHRRPMSDTNNRHNTDTKQNSDKESGLATFRLTSSSSENES